MRELEEQLKVRLFDRNRRKVELSPAGAKLLAHARRIFQMLLEAEPAARAQADP